MLQMVVYIAPSLETSLKGRSLDELSSSLINALRTARQFCGLEPKEMSLTAIYAAYVDKTTAEVQVELRGEMDDDDGFKESIAQHLIGATKYYLRMYPRVSVSVSVISQCAYFRISRD